MATRTAVSDAELQLRKRARRRLVGAIALVVLVVAAVPMLLDEQPRPPETPIDVDIPPVPSSPDGPLTEAPAQTPPLTAVPAPTDSVAPPQLAPAPPAPAAPAPGPLQLAPGAAASAANEHFAVQLIATISPAKARELRQKLERQKFPVYTERTPDGAKTRVRVGPYASREAAEQARQRLDKAGFDPGQVVRKGE